MLPMFASLLTPGGVLGIVERNFDGPPALRERFAPIARRYSAVQNYRPTDLVVELEQRNLFDRRRERVVGPEPWRPTVDEYLECRFSQRGFSRTHMEAEAASGFETAARAMLREAHEAGEIARSGERLEVTASARVTWGKPRSSGRG